jgi:acyl-coenzyme A thioesterase PaaI-like protein
MTEEELQALLERTTPARERYELFVEQCQDQDVRLRFSPPQEQDQERGQERAKGGGWSMASLLAVTDISLRAAAREEASVTHLNVTRIRSAQPADVLALSRVIRRDRDVIHAESWLFSHAVVEPMLHATATLRRPGG